MIEQIRQIAPNLVFRETAITVATRDEDASEEHAECFESRPIRLGVEASRISLDNSKPARAIRHRLPEADRANMERLLEYLAIILPVTGLDMLESHPPAVTPTTTPIEGRIADDAQFEIRRKNGVRATAVKEDGEFIVLERSGVLSGKCRDMPSYVDLRSKLTAEGMPTKRDEITMHFAKSWPHSNLSAAASIGLNRCRNSPVDWKSKDSTQTHCDWKRTQSISQEGAE